MLTPRSPVRIDPLSPAPHLPARAPDGPWESWPSDTFPQALETPSGVSHSRLVEFRAPDDIWREYPKGVRELAEECTCSTVAGQPTDDSEMAMLLARVLADQGRSDPEEARKAYIFW